MLSWTYAFAWALKPRGIGVSFFCPGLTTTHPDGLTYPQKMGWFDHAPEKLATPGSVKDCAAALLNVRSRRLLERIGFRLIGLQRDCHVMHGSRFGRVLYDLLPAGLSNGSGSAGNRA